jgi:hypothetical protein
MQAGVRERDLLKLVKRGQKKIAEHGDGGRREARRDKVN